MKRYLVAALAILAVGCHPVNAGPWPTDDVTTTYYDGIGSESPAQARPELYNGMLRLKDVIGARGSASGVCPLDATSKVPLANIPDTLTGKTVSGGTDIAIADGGTGASDATTARANLGCATSGANTDITSISVNNTGLAAKDTDASHALTIKPNSNLTTNRTLSITTGDADRTLDISSGNVTITSTGASILDDTSNAAVLATIGAAARGANTDITSAYLNNTGLKVKDTDATHGLVIAPGSNLTADRQLTITTGDVPRTLDISASNVTISSAAAGLLDDSTQAAMLTTLGAAPLSGATFTGDITTYLAGAPSTGVIYLGNNSGSRYLYYDGARYVMSGAPLWLNGGYVWTEVNDGAGTGLDADTVDGLHASSLATSGANSNITSLTGLTGAVTSTKSCASGYTRVGPNYCERTVSGAEPGLARDICTDVLLPSGAVSVIINLSATAQAANSIGVRFTFVESYPNNTCTTNLPGLSAIAEAYEFSAVSTNLGLSRDEKIIIIKDTDGDGKIHLKMRDDGGNFGEGGYYIVGYLD